LEYIYDIAGHVVAEDNGTSWDVGYAYAGDRLVAQYDSDTTHFIHQDHLGSTRLVTDINGNVVDSIDYLPYGEQIAGDTATTHKFTGKERDGTPTTETGLDNFGARYLTSSYGRFMTPDQPLLYQDKLYPQSWNLYSYVRNNPLNRIDPDGHLTIIVPGTGWKPDDWNYNMKLISEAKEEFHDNDVYILPWSGSLSQTAIGDGAKMLQDVVNSHTFASGEKLNIIGHSRGGDVAIAASAEPLGHKIDNLVTLDTPNYGFMLTPGLDNIVKWLNVMVLGDWVAPFVSRENPSQFSGAINLQIQGNSSQHIQDHSAVWSDAAIRAQWWRRVQEMQCQEWFDTSTNTVHGCVSQ
jgi:RHS repeat-associated protein